jgi:hypothetical protein
MNHADDDPEGQLMSQRAALLLRETDLDEDSKLIQQATLAQLGQDFYSRKELSELLKSVREMERYDALYGRNPLLAPGYLARAERRNLECRVIQLINKYGLSFSG